MSAVSVRKIILTSLLVDLIDIVTNIGVAFLTNSTVMVAETLQGMADLTAVLFLFIGLVRSGKPADSIHPFGYGREIYFWTLVSSILMLTFTAGISFLLGWQRFLHPEQLSNLNWAYVVLLIAIVTNSYALSLDIRRIFSHTDPRLFLKDFLESPWIETKTTFVLDLMGVLAACCGLGSLIIYSVTGNFRFDGIGAMGIGIILAVLSLLLILGVRELLIGRRASKKIEQAIKQTALSFPEVREIIGLKTIHSGSERIFINLDVHLKNELDTDTIEKLLEDIKKKIQQQVPTAGEIQIELKTSSPKRS